MKKKYLAIIPARKGSKRLLNKNTKLLNGKPLVYYTIEAAKQSHLFDEIVVSTDSEEIIEIAHKNGVNAPFKRPKELSDDTSSSFDVVMHVLDYYSTQNVYFENIVLLQPTSPLRTSEDISSAISMFEDLKASSVTSVCETAHSPLWSNTLGENMSMNNFLKSSVKNKRTQDLEKYFRLNGAIYICNVEAFISGKAFICHQNSFAYVMNKEHSVDVDNDFDFKLVEFLMNKA